MERRRLLSQPSGPSVALGPAEVAAEPAALDAAAAQPAQPQPGPQAQQPQSQPQAAEQPQQGPGPLSRRDRAQKAATARWQKHKEKQSAELLQRLKQSDSGAAIELSLSSFGL